MAKETAIRLVMINGVARYGMPGLMSALGAQGETLRVGGKTRSLYLDQATADPDVSGMSWGAARSALRVALRNLPKLARKLENPKSMPLRRSLLDAPEPVVWSLALDEIQETAVDLGPRLPFNGPNDFTGPERVSSRAATAPLSVILQPIDLDPLTVADDPDFLSNIANQPNVPEPIRTGLASLY